MDSITQVVLGASVGELVLGKKVGSKAPLWGAVSGTLPDLDVLTATFLSESAQLGVHRGLSHSLFFAIVGGAALGYALSRLHRDASWREWSLLWFLGILTHALLDCFTMYGTQLFSPFSNYPVALGSIFIIDPLYTLPLGAGLVAALCQQRLHWRRKLNAIGLGLSTAYLLFTAASYLHVRTAFSKALDDQGIAHERLFVTPTPFNAVLWAGLAKDGDHLWSGLYSLLDDVSKMGTSHGDAAPPNIRFHRIERNTHLIADKLDQGPIQRLLWFSRGYYHVERRADGLYFNDLRFGRSDSYLDTAGTYIFVFRLLADPQDPTHVPDFRQRPPFEAREGETFDPRILSRLWRRIGGDKTVAGP